MSRYEFIEKLRAALSGKATQSAINENIRYYEEYLDTEIRKGKREEDVIRELGDPRLLAKTIIEANKQSSQSRNYGEVYQNAEDYQSNAEYKNTHVYIRGKEYAVPKWGIILTLLLVAAIVIGVVGTVLSILLPIVVPVVLLLAAVKIVSILIRKS